MSNGRNKYSRKSLKSVKSKVLKVLKVLKVRKDFPQWMCCRGEGPQGADCRPDISCAGLILLPETPDFIGTGVWGDFSSVDGSNCRLATKSLIGN